MIGSSLVFGDARTIDRLILSFCLALLTLGSMQAVEPHRRWGAMTPLLPSKQSRGPSIPFGGSTWTHFPVLDSEQSQVLSCFDPVNRMIYAFGGAVPLASLCADGNTSFARYSVTTRTWMLLEPVSVAGAGADWGRLVYCRGRIYFFGGVDNDGNPLSKCEVYDTSTNAWTSIADMPMGDCCFQDIVWRDSLVYIMGGLVPSYGTDTVQIYDALTNTWSIGTSMLTECDMSDACIIGDTIFFAGGYDRWTGELDTMLRTGAINPDSPGQITWAWGQRLPSPRLRGPTVAMNGSVYWFCGFTTLYYTPPTSAGYCYTPGIGIVESLPSFPDPASDNWSVVDPDQSTIYSLGGSLVNPQDPGNYEISLPVSPKTYPMSAAAPSSRSAALPGFTREATTVKIPDLMRNERHRWVDRGRGTGDGRSRRSPVFGLRSVLPYADSGWKQIAHPSVNEDRLAQACVWAPSNDNIYMYGGMTNGVLGSALNQLDRYDPNANTWHNVASMSTARAWIKGLYCRGRLYAIGGYSNSGTALSTCEAYDIATNTWSPIADLPNGDAAYQAVNWRDSLLYICGGTGPGPLFTGTRAVNIYNPATNVWTAADSLPYPIDMSDACIIGDTIWIPGGYDRQNNMVYSTLLAGGIDPSNPTRITWSTVAQLPAPNFLEPAVAFDGKVYFWSYDPVPRIWRFNPATRVFDTIPYPLGSTSTLRCCFAVVRPSARELYKIAGNDGGLWTPPNNTYYKYRFPLVADVGATRITAPSAAEDSGDTVVPSSSIKNFGPLPEGFRILMRIGTGYADTLCTVVNPGESKQVSFSPWVASICGPAVVQCSTMLGSDSIPDNNAVTESTYVAEINAQINLLLPDTVAPGQYQQRALLKNNSDVLVSMQAIVSLLRNDTLLVYSDSATTKLPAGAQDTMIWGRIWNATPGQYLAVARVGWRHGVLDSTGSTVIVTGAGVEESGDRNLPPSRVELEAAQPNPFGVRTLIGYAIPKGEFVSLQLFASSGRIVRTLSNGMQRTGIYHAAWDGRGDDGRPLPCGVYICRLEAGGQRMTRKLVLTGE